MQWLFSVLSALMFFYIFLEIHYESDSIELLLIENKIIGWDSAPYLVRFSVAGAWLIALLCLFPNQFRKWALYIIMFIAGITAAYITLQLVRYGVKGQCRCFHLYLNHNPYKVLITLFISSGIPLLAIILYKKDKLLWNKKLQYLTVMLLMSGFLVLSFSLNPLYYEIKDPPKPGTYLPLNLLYPENGRKPSTDLRKGKYIVGFMSFTCPYCKIAAKKFRVLKKLNPDMPLYMIVTGLKENERQFFEKTGSANVPHFKYVNKDIFWELAQNAIPSIYLIENSVIVSRIHHSQLRKKNIEQWLYK